MTAALVMPRDAAVPAGGPAIVVDGVSKRFRLYRERNQSVKAAIMRGGRASYDELWALRDVSLEIPRGVTYGLVGANGSGKSTLLKCIARILRPDTGTIMVDGSMSALLELGAGFHPELSGRENVFLNASILGLTRREVAGSFDEIVAFAGPQVERAIDSPVKNYSSGMYVRLGFSIAINVDPQVLLVDEVLSVGDESFQRRCDEKFAELKNAGKTIVLVSHALDSVRRMCDLGVWLADGVVQAQGAPGNLIDDYIDASHDDVTHVTSPAGKDAGTRWGSGEATIDEIQLLDAAGRAVDRLPMNSAATLRLAWSTREPVRRPVFGIALYTADGTHVTGVNAREAGAIPAVLDGAGVVDFHVPVLPLVPGVYQVTAAIMDEANLHTWDWRHRALTFDVEAGTPREVEGMFHLAGSWDVTGT